MSPLRGLSKSDIRSRDIARATGKIRRTAGFFPWELKPNKRLQKMEMIIISTQAAVGMRFQPRGLRVPLRVQYVVHASEDERGYRGRLDNGERESR
jgi:hypothetical protein